MLDHNVFESAALLAKALEKLEAKRRDKLARIDDWAAEERKRILSAADPEAIRLVEQAEADSHNDLETPEEFASRQWAWLDLEAMTKAVRARDAAVRAEALRWHEDTSALRLGRALPCAVLEPERVRLDYVAQPGFGDGRTSAAKAAKADWWVRPEREPGDD